MSSIYYMIDAHTNPVTSSPIKEVLPSQEGITSTGNPAVVANGSLPIRVPDTVKLASDPTDLNDLLTKKFEGYLANYPGLTNIIYDDALDSSDLFATNATLMSKLGSRNTAGYCAGSGLRTAIIDVSPATISSAVVIAEFHRWRFVNPKSGRCERIYEEVDLDTAPSIALSTNNAVNFTGMPNGDFGFIPAGEEGSLVQIRFEALNFNPEGQTNPISGETIFLSSWALLY